MSCEKASTGNHEGKIKFSIMTLTSEEHQLLVSEAVDVLLLNKLQEGT